MSDQPQTFDEWKQKRRGWNVGIATAREQDAWDAAIASQQAEIERRDQAIERWDATFNMRLKEEIARYEAVVEAARLVVKRSAPKLDEWLVEPLRNALAALDETRPGGVL